MGAGVVGLENHNAKRLRHQDGLSLFDPDALNKRPV
jgi:hypothetical protein